MSLQQLSRTDASVATRAVTARVSRQFTGTIECVFDAWLDPVEPRARFLSPPTAGEVVRTEIDARIGGRFSFVRRENVLRSGEPGSISRSIDLTCSRSASATTTRKPTDDRVIIELASVGLGRSWS